MRRALALVIALTFSVGLTAATIVRSPELAFNLPSQGQRLLSQYRSKVVALEFISTTCPHCQAAVKVMNAIQKRFGDRRFQAIGVAINLNADLRVEHFAREYQLTFPVGWTRIEQMMSYMGFTDRPVVPQLVLIDRDGNIHYQTPREGDADSMRKDVIAKRIEELLDLRLSSKVRRP